MRVRVNLKLINRAYSDCYTASRSQERTFFKKKTPAAVHHTHTHTGLKHPKNVIFPTKKRACGSA
jgi:hypothetical protein